MADTTCSSHWAVSYHGDCIHALAEGWILHVDLCPSCTTRFMAALDGISGPLPWHAEFHHRAERCLS